MVLSLFDICRIEIRNGLSNGAFSNVHILPANLRQSILDFVLMHGDIDKPTCRSILSSKEFLTDMTCLDLHSGTVNDSEYLDQLAETLSTNSADGKTIGSRISELKLNLYCFSLRIPNHDDDDDSGDFGTTVNLKSAIRLISRCPQLEKLHLRLVEFKIADRTDYETIQREDTYDLLLFTNDENYHAPGLLNRSEFFESCESILENLKEFSFINKINTGKLYRPFINDDDHPILEFRQLNSLRLKNVTLDGGAWLGLMNDVQDTLVNLRLDAVDISGRSKYVQCYLPFPLPNLKSLIVKDEKWAKNEKIFVKNLSKCTKLEYVRLLIERDSDLHEDRLRTLADLKAQIEIDLKFFSFTESNHVLDENSSWFKFVEILGEKVKRFTFSAFHWNRRFTLAMDHLIRSCPNLEGFAFSSPFPEFMDDPSSVRELQATKVALSALFADKSRASKLRRLSISGDYNPSVLTLIFENCVNLDRFEIIACPHLTDNDLIDWARRGARLSEFYINLKDCTGITDEGILPLLISSGSKMTKFQPVNAPHILTDRLCRGFIEHCRYMKYMPVMDQEMMDLAVSKMFRLPLETLNEDDE